jgi:hypothetical protein
MKRLIEFLFFRWKKEVMSRGSEKWFQKIVGTPIIGSEYIRDFVDYKYTNKFDGSTKIKREYLN